jgi:hypothetical protein
MGEVLFADQPDIGLMHQRSRLERLARLFLSQFGGRQPAQLVINQRQELARRAWISALNRGQECG